MNLKTLEPFATTSDSVPEHRQFVQMMHDVQAQAQRRKEAPGTLGDEGNLANRIAKLEIVPAEAEQPCTGTSRDVIALSAVSTTFYDLGPKGNPVTPSTVSPNKAVRVENTSVIPVPVKVPQSEDEKIGQAAKQPSKLAEIVISPVSVEKTCHITIASKRDPDQEEPAVDPERLELLEKRYLSDTRQWYVLFIFTYKVRNTDYHSFKCSKPCNRDCYRQKHFRWCGTHGRMTNKQHPCPGDEPQVA